MKLRLHFTMRQLAALAGVSHVTVSRALRNDPSISPATTRKIRALADRHGYRSNPLVSALMTQLRVRRKHTFRPTIAFLNSWWPPSLWMQDNTYTSQFAGAQERAAELGFKMDPFWINDPTMPPARLVQVLRTRQIHGALIGPTGDTTRLLHFPWDEFALATIGYSLRQPDMHRTCTAHFYGMYRAMEELMAHGYKRIGYITSLYSERRMNSLWGAAFRQQQHNLPAESRVEPLIFARAADATGIRRWLKAERPDAIISSQQNVYDLLLELGLKIPGPVPFVHLDLNPRLKQAGVSGIDQLSVVVGATAAELVINQLNTNQRGLPANPITQLVEGVWCEGAAIRKRRAGAAAGRRKPVAR